MVWNEDEERQYEAIAYSSLLEVYEDAGLSRSDPQGRARFLLNTVLDLSEGPKGEIVDMMYIMGKPATLNFLEELTKRVFEEQKEQNLFK